MKLKKEFLVHVTDPESFLVPTGAAAFSGLVRGNATFGRVLELLRGDTSAEAIVKALREEFDAPEAVIGSDVQKALAALRSVGALDE